MEVRLKYFNSVCVNGTYFFVILNYFFNIVGLFLYKSSEINY